MRTAARWVALAASVLLVVEATSWIALRVIEQRRGLRYRAFDGLIDPWRKPMEEIVAADGTWYQRIDPELGWITIPGAFTDDAAITASGIRATHDYADAPPTGVLRIAAFGDSFVHGDEVATDETWEAALERALPGAEVLNYGVGGYGLDQALLRYVRDGAAKSPHVVLLGVITDDVLRGVNVFRPFFAPDTGHVLTKPRFLLDGAGTLALTVYDTDLSDESYIRLFVDYNRPDPTPARASCKASGSGQPRRTTTCDISGVCQTADIGQERLLWVEVFDREPLDSGEPRFRAMPADGLSSRWQFFMKCEDIP